jgi:hypothetical protein
MSGIPRPAGPGAPGTARHRRQPPPPGPPATRAEGRHGRGPMRGGRAVVPADRRHPVRGPGDRAGTRAAHRRRRPTAPRPQPGARAGQTHRHPGTCPIEVRPARAPLRPLVRMRLDIGHWSAAAIAVELIPCQRVRPSAACSRVGRALLDSLTCAVGDASTRAAPCRRHPTSAARGSGRTQYRGAGRPATGPVAIPVRHGGLMNRIHHPSARRASPPGRAEPHPRQPQGQRPHPAGRPGRGGSARRFIQDIAAAASVTVGQHRPAPTIPTPRRRTMTAARPRPHTIQLCIHCRQSPAGFWVSGNGGMPARRPWSLPCCQGPDPGRYHVIPFAGPADAGLVR